MYPLGYKSFLVCAVCAKSLQSCSTLYDPMDYSLPGPLSMGFSRQGYWSGLPFPSPGDLPDPGIAPVSLMCPALAGRFFTTNATWEVQSFLRMMNKTSLMMSY